MHLMFLFLKKSLLKIKMTSVSIYQQVRDYFISRDMYSLEMISTHCSQKMTRHQLNIYFGKNIKKHDVSRFRKIYKEECITALTKVSKANPVGGEFWQSRLGTALSQMSTMVYDTMTSERVFQLDSVYSFGKWVPKLEKLLNMFAFTGSFFLPWSVFITMYPSGRKLITDIFSKPGIQSVIAFYCVLYTIRTQESYDDYFFREEIVQLIPYVSLPEVILKTFNMPLIGGKIVDDKVIQQWYHYITLNLVSQSSLKKTSALLDSKLTSAFLQALSDALESYIYSQKDKYVIMLQHLLSQLHSHDRIKPTHSSFTTQWSKSGGETPTHTVSQTIRSLLSDPSPIFVL